MSSIACSANFDQRAATPAECKGWLPVAAIGPHGNRLLPLSFFELFDKGREFVHIRKNKLGPGGQKAIFVVLIAMAAANKPEHAHTGGAPKLVRQELRLRSPGSSQEHVPAASPHAERDPEMAFL